jgi:hypothetical protein
MKCLPEKDDSVVSIWFHLVGDERDAVLISSIQDLKELAKGVSGSGVTSMTINLAYI